MHAAENAVLAKMRAMYARRLTAAQFRDILGCHSMGEVAAYLKDKTPYGAYMTDNASFADIHREWLEECLRQALHRQFETLSYYAYAINAQVYRYFVVEREVELLGRSLALAKKHSGGILPAASPFFSKHSSVNWRAVEQADSPQAWLAALDGSPYYTVCAPFVSGADGTVDMVLLDQALERYKMRLMMQLADTAYERGPERQALLEQLRIRVDLKNIVNLYRAGILGHQKVPTANSALITEGGLLNTRQLQQLIGAADTAAFCAALQHTRYEGMIDLPRDGYIEHSVDRYLFRVCEHALRFTPHPSVALLSYVTLHRLELQNVIHSIESVRYGAAETAAGMLVGIEI